MFFFKWVYMHLNVSFKICAKLLWNQIQKSLCFTTYFSHCSMHTDLSTQMTITQFLSKLKINMYIFPTISQINEKSQTNNKEIQLKAFHSLLPVSYIAINDKNTVGYSVALGNVFWIIRKLINLWLKIFFYKYFLFNPAWVKPVIPSCLETLLKYKEINV